MSNRTALKGYFVTNAVPKQNDFADLIDSVLIQAEDGIRKLGKAPVALQAQEDLNGERQVLHFYKSFTDDSPAWKVSLLNQDPNSANDLNIGNSSAPTAQNALFIKSNGNVGIGTSNPRSKLDLGVLNKGQLGSVLGRLPEGDDTDDGTFLGVRGYVTQVDTDNPEGNVKSFALEHNFYGQVNSSINFFRGDIETGGFLTFNTDANTERVRIDNAGNVGIGTPSPGAKLHVSGGDVVVDGTIRPSMGNTDVTGIHFGYDPAGGGGDHAWIRYRAQYDDKGAMIADNTVLELGTANDTDDHIALMPTGNVGIGTTFPRAKLHVQGAIHAGTSELYFTGTNHSHTGYGNTQGYAAIENDGTATYNALMILGRMRTDGKRYVSLWDQLNVYGNAYVNGAQVSTSDVRIKHKIAPSNTAQDLEMINKLTVKEYKVRNSGMNESSLQKGFIAQEVEPLLPDAVVLQSDFIPDVFSFPQSVVIKEGTLVITLKDDHGFATGDIVRFVTSSGNKEAIIEVINEKIFSVDNWQSETSDLFVYGKKVDDFRSLNYNAIFTLGISAIQELYKQLKQLKEELKAIKISIPPAFAPAM